MNEVWLNLDWWAVYPGGPYFEGDRRIVVCQSDKLIPPKVVPVIDTMDSTVGWKTLKDEDGSNISIKHVPSWERIGSQNFI